MTTRTTAEALRLGPGQTFRRFRRLRRTEALALTV